MKKIHVIELKLLSWSVAALWSGDAVELGTELCGVMQVE
jgi:hypothetical protein